MSDSRAELTQALETLLRAIGPPAGPTRRTPGRAAPRGRADPVPGPRHPSPQLRHFLQRRSYVKALEYLQGG